MEIKCSRCGRNVPDGARFCGGCGLDTQAELICHSCGATNSINNKFCEQCGTRVDVITEPEPNPYATESIAHEVNAFFQLVWQMYLVIFPNLHNVKPVKRASYWVAAIFGPIVAAIGGIFAAMIVGIVPAIPFPILSFVHWVVTFGIITGVFGHYYFGRMLDAGIATPSNFSLIGYACIALLILSVFGLSWLSSLVSFIYVIYLGMLPSTILAESIAEDIESEGGQGTEKEVNPIIPGPLYSGQPLYPASGSQDKHIEDRDSSSKT